MIGDINHIVIIESLINERETGTELYNDIITRHIEYRKSKITHKLHKVHTKDDYKNVLNYYHANSPYMDGGILLHLEMHGDEELTGLILSDGSLITWEELIVLFRPINVNSNNNLYVIIATCNGRFLYKGVHPHEKSPYSCFISARETVSNIEIIEQFSILFEKLIENGNLVNSYLEMEKYGTKFYYKDSKAPTFEEAFKATTKRFMTDPYIKKSILEEARKQIEKEGLQMPPEQSYDFIAELALKDTYKKHKKAFDFD